MRILLYSSVFLPSIGGIEASSLSLAQGFCDLGHDVILVSETPVPPGYDSRFSFPVIRCPSDSQWRSLLSDRHIIVSNGHTLRHLHIWRRSRIPFGWIHAMILGSPFSHDFGLFLRLHFRRLTTHLAYFNVAVSEWMKNHIRNKDAVVILNPVNAVFRPLTGIVPSGRFLFYGRMWNPKGMGTLLHALAICKRKGLPLPTDFIGDGPDLSTTRQISDHLQLQDIVAFHPALSPEELLEPINRSLAVIVPSQIPESFGLTAAESMTCGKCVVVATSGGLPEVVADTCPTFPPGDSQKLADILAYLARNPEALKRHESLALQRSTLFSVSVVCRQYLELFQTVLDRYPPRR